MLTKFLQQRQGRVFSIYIKSRKGRLKWKERYLQRLLRTLVAPDYPILGTPNLVSISNKNLGNTVFKARDTLPRTTTVQP